MATTAAGNAELAGLSIIYGGKQAAVFLFVVALLVTVLALCGWMMNTPLMWLFAVAAAILLISALVTRRVMIGPGGKSLRIDWNLARRFPLHSRTHLLAHGDSLVVWRAPEIEAGYGAINIIFRPAKGRDVPVQVYDTREANLSCPEAEYLIAQIVELTGLPVEEHIGAAMRRRL